MNAEKVLNLAKLARIEISAEEADSLSNEFGAILGYVGEVKSATSGSDQATDNFLVKNVLREDGEPHESGVYTEKLLAEAPSREGGYIKVKKIL